MGEVTDHELGLKTCGLMRLAKERNVSIGDILSAVSSIEGASNNTIRHIQDSIESALLGNTFAMREGFERARLQQNCRASREEINKIYQQAESLYNKAHRAGLLRK